MNEDRDPETDFVVFMDRAKSKVFKQMWHAAEFELEVRERWSSMQQLIKDCRAAVVRDVPAVIESFRMLMWLDVHPYEHKRVVDDMMDAMAAMTFFFKPTAEKVKAFLSSADAEQLKELGDNQWKATSLQPYARTPHSNLTRSKASWEDIDRVRKAAKDPIVREWDLHCRPRIAQLARAGVIGPGYYPHPCGRATATAEADQKPYLTMDYRISKDWWPTKSQLSHIRDFRQIHLLPLAQSFAKKHKDACFSLLRVWTHPVFFPLMLGFDNRESTCFYDTLGRAWEFKVSIHCSELSIRGFCADYSCLSAI